MAKASEVLEMLCPGIEYVSYGQNYEDVYWFDKSPAITKKQFEGGFAQVDAWKLQQAAEAAAKRQALLDKLGITEEEAKLLLG